MFILIKKIKYITLVFFITILPLSTSFSIDISNIDSTSQYYTILEGDEIMKISYKFYGTHQKWRSIVEANPGLDPGSITTGRTILIPNVLKTKKHISNIKNREPIKKVLNKPIKVSKKYSKEKSIIKHQKKKVTKKSNTFIENKKKSPPLKKLTVGLLNKQKREIIVLQNINSQLEAKLIRSEQEFQWVRLRMATLKKKEKIFSNYQKEKSNLQFTIKELRIALNKKTKETTTISKSSPIYLPGMLSYSSEQVLKEKNRLLSQKFWVAKNKEIDKCNINVFSNLKSAKEKIEEFIYYVNETLGSSNVFIDPSTNKLTLQLSGKAVYGIKDPKVRKKFQKLLSEISQKMINLPIEGVHILGLTRLSSVRHEDGKKISSEYYSLIQSNAIKKFFINTEGWSPKILSNGTFGSSFQAPLKSNKRFDVIITLKHFFESNKRSIASIIQEDPMLRNITDEILMKLGEPKFGSVDLNSDSLDIHMAQHYFVSKFNNQLTKEGKSKIDIIVSMFQLVADSTFQLELNPGTYAEDSKLTHIKLLNRLQSIKRYIFTKHPWIKGRVEFIVGNKYRPLVIAKTEKEDRMNKRLIFRIIPTSIHIRELQEPSP